MDNALSHVTDNCHICSSLKKVPEFLIEQSTSEPPDAVGCSFTADIMKRNKQLIFVLRETVTSYTSSCIVDNERHDSLRAALIRMCIELRPLDGPVAVVHTDPASGFLALRNDELLREFRIAIETGCAKNVNKNPVAERAVQELEEELLKQQPDGGPVSMLILAVATARLNSRIRSRGLSAREMWLQRDQFSNTQIPISDRTLISEQHTLRSQNHLHSERSKAPKSICPPRAEVNIGDLVYIWSDKNKSQARDRYLVVSVDGEWCYIRKFTGAQLRSSSYKVKLSDCYTVPGYSHSHVPSTHFEDESCEVTDPVRAPIQEEPRSPLTVPLEISAPPLPMECHPSPGTGQELDATPLSSSESHSNTDQPTDSSPNTTWQGHEDAPPRRSSGNRKPPPWHSDGSWVLSDK